MPSTESTIQSPAGPIKLPVGVSDFGKLIRERYTFVDKSRLIKDVIEDGAAVTLITRPRRFGKTVNLSMLHHFFASEVRGQPTRALFDGLAISRDPVSMAQQAQWPVVFFSFKDIKESCFETAEDKVRDAIATLYKGYPELLDSPHLAEDQRAEIAAIRTGQINRAVLSNAFGKLCEFLYLHTRKNVLVLIDEYDTPIHAAYSNGYYQEMTDFMRGLLSAVLKDNPYLYKAVVTGILRVAKESRFSGINNLEICTVLEKAYNQYFGFTEAEMETLLGCFDSRKNISQIQSWYNGYQFGDYVIYNPWSIVNYLKHGSELRPYWVNTSDNTLLKELMARAGGRFKQQMEPLLQGGDIEQLIDPNIVFGDLNKSAMALWSLLLFSGYLTAGNSRYDIQGRATCRLRVPNLEVLGLYQRHIEEWFSDTMGREEYGDFLNCLVTGKVEEFETRLAEYLRESASSFDASKYHPEKFYHGLVLGLIAGLKETHLIYSNRESGFGRYDVAVLPRERGLRETTPNDQRLGILMEFKSAKGSGQLENTAREALQQIDRQYYQAELEQHRIDRIIKIGLAFFGKQMAMAASAKTAC